jgi:hypothetical protein
MARKHTPGSQTPQVQPANRRGYLAPPAGSTGAAGNSRERGNPNIRPGEAPGGPPPLHRQVTTRQRARGRGPWADTGGALDYVIVQDRHPYLAHEREITGRDSGLKDPMLDGPVRRVVRMLCRDWTMWQGSDNTANYDPPRAYQRYGMQDGTVTTVFGGQPGYFQPYASRGGPLTVPTATSGAEQIPAGPPHGLHTHTVTSRAMTLKSYRDNAQQVGGRQDRLSNSRRGGQSYSQTTTHQGG